MNSCALLLATAAASPPTGPNLWSALPTLLLFFLFLAGAAWFLIKRPPLGLLQRKTTPDGPALEVLATRNLGNRQFLLVVGVGPRRFLLGVSPGAIQRLADLEGAPSFADALDDKETDA